MQQGVSGWFAIRVDIIAVCMMTFTTFTCILARGNGADLDIVLSMLLSYTLTIQFALVWVLK